MILCLDLGTKCGWAVQHPDGRIDSGCENFATKRHEGGGMRFLKFRRWLEGRPKPAEVYFEEVRRHAGTTAAHIYGGLMAELTAWCEANQIPYGTRTVQAIKKMATGKGGGPGTKKEHMIAAAQRAGRDITDDNEADAYWLLRLVLSEREDIFS